MVQVIIRGLDIIELVAERRGDALTLTEISEKLTLNQSTVANIIQTLVHKGYLEHIGTKKGYRLGPAAFQLTNQNAYGQELISASQDVMEQLTTLLGESCILGVLRNNKRYTLNVVNSRHDIQVQVHSERNVYDTASGRLLIAYLNPGELKRFIDLNGLPTEALWPGVITTEVLKTQLESIKREGIVFTDHKDRHVKGYAVPVWAKGGVVAGLSVFLPEFRCSTSKEQEIITALQRAATEVSARLG